MLSFSLHISIVLTVATVHGYHRNGSWSAGERPFTSQITRLICPGQPYKYSVMHQCKVKLVRNQPSLITAIGTILEPQPEVLASLTLSYKYTTGYQPFLLDFKGLDICEYLSENPGQGPNVLVNVAYKILQEKLPSLVRGKCPLNGTYSVQNFALDANMLPPVVPAGDYRNEIRLFRPDNVTLFAFQLYGFVRAKGIADLSLG